MGQVIICIFFSSGHYYILENCGNNCHLWMELNTTDLWEPEEEPQDTEEDRNTPEYQRVASPKERLIVSS